MADKPQKSWQARSEFNERRYRRVDTRVWNDARVRGFSPTGRLVWVLLLTAPSTTAIPGLFRMREEEGAALCGLTLEGFREGFAEGFRLGLVEADWVAGVVWVRKASRYEWPTAPNVVKNWRKVLRSEIPESPLVDRAMSQIREELQRVYDDPEPFNQAFAEAFPEGFAEGLPEPFAEGSPAQDAGCRMQDAGSFSSPPPASASAVLGQGNLLPGVPPTHPAKPARKARWKIPSPDKPTDPRHAPLVAALTADGWPFDGGKDAAQVKGLLALADQQEATRGDKAQAEVLRRARIAWSQFPAFHSARTLTQLRMKWGEFAAPIAGGGASAPAPVVPIRRLVEM